MRIEGKFSGAVDVKRFYIPGVKVFSPCPKCKDDIEKDLSSEYLSYPDEKGSNLYFYCGECNSEWEEKVVLEVTLKAAT